MRFFTYRGVEHYIKKHIDHVNLTGFKESIIRKYVVADDVYDKATHIKTMENFINATISNVNDGNDYTVSNDKAYCMVVYVGPKAAIDTAIANHYGLEGLMVVHDELDRFMPGMYLSTSTVLGAKVITINGMHYTEIETNNTIYFVLPTP